MEILFIKTARSWFSAIARTYTDLHILPVDAFTVMIHDFPKEGDIVRQFSLARLEKYNVLTDPLIFNKVKNHSSRSVGSNFEE